MKFLSLILAVIIFTLSAIPCSDGHNFEDQHQEEISTNHNHQEDRDDSCPITCICNCCGMSIAFETLRLFDLIFYSRISTQLIATYQPIYRFDFHSKIWQPPQVIR